MVKELIMLKLPDKIEFYMQDSNLPFKHIDSSFAPLKGDLINIKKIIYKVVDRSFTIDYDGEWGQQIRCNVIVTEYKE